MSPRNSKKLKQLFLYGQRTANNYQFLPGGESNPGLLRDRRGYSPLYYRGNRWLSELLFKFFTQIKSFSVVKNGQKQQQTTYFSTAGNRTPVSRVTGGDTRHYTTEEADGCLNSCLNFSLKLSHFLLKRMAKNSNKLRISPRRGIEPRSPA